MPFWQDTIDILVLFAVPFAAHKSCIKKLSFLPIFITLCMKLFFSAWSFRCCNLLRVSGRNMWIENISSVITIYSFDINSKIHTHTHRSRFHYNLCIANCMIRQHILVMPRDIIYIWLNKMPPLMQTIFSNWLSWYLLQSARYIINLCWLRWLKLYIISWLT